MWILDRIHEEIKDDEKMSRLSDYPQKVFKFTLKHFIFIFIKFKSGVKISKLY